MNRSELTPILEEELVETPLLELDDVSWRPSLASVDGHTAVYVCESGSLGGAMTRRLRSFSDSGLRVVVALPQGPLQLDAESQSFLLEMGIEIVTPDAPQDLLRIYKDFGEMTYSRGILLEPDVARPAVINGLEQSLQDTGQDKGTKLERALALAVSQVPGWEIDSMNLRTKNEELDIVIANNSAMSPWNGTGYILLEAKNWSGNVDRAEYDAFFMKVKERGGFCRLGLFVAAVGFSAGFYTRAEHHGTEHFSIVPLSVEWLIKTLRAGGTVEASLAERVRQVVLDRHWEESDFA